MFKKKKLPQTNTKTSTFSPKKTKKSPKKINKKLKKFKQFQHKFNIQYFIKQQRKTTKKEIKTRQEFQIL